MDLRAILKKPARFAIGLMSGTSCDGVDAALVRIKGTGRNLHLKFIDATTIPYPLPLRNRLLNQRMSVTDACLLNFELGERFAEAVLEMLQVAKKENLTVDFVASHGHTIAHVPPRGHQASGTLQIGESAVMAERTGLPVVSDFRPRDMAAGGQGAPLAPYADWALFHRSDRVTLCLNIGGIANVTVVPPEFPDVFAFDTGPGNMIIDDTVGLLTRGTQRMDIDGVKAAKGTPIPEFLDYLLGHRYFSLKPPKSTGREEFGAEVYLRDALANRRDHSYEDLLATVTAAVGDSIIDAIERFVKPNHIPTHCVVSGGGAHNITLLDHLRGGLPGLAVNTSDEYGIPSDAREAVAFAILGNETLFGTSANVPAATGAGRPVVLGKITPGGGASTPPAKSGRPKLPALRAD
ncbi:MAG: anhydro-N-acetylmuramic acid kinase [Nitrospiraceae bacterium]|nr:anhydro-N-acetylmuramic acid kinase [Nitrospiraceae bacterium]